MEERNKYSYTAGGSGGTRHLCVATFAAWLKIQLTLHGQLRDLVTRRHQRHDARALTSRLLGSTGVQKQHSIGLHLGEGEAGRYASGSGHRSEPGRQQHLVGLDLWDTVEGRTPIYVMRNEETSLGPV